MDFRDGVHLCSMKSLGFWQSGKWYRSVYSLIMLVGGYPSSLWVKEVPLQMNSLNEEWVFVKCSILVQLHAIAVSRMMTERIGHQSTFLIFHLPILKYWKWKEYIKATKSAGTVKHLNNTNLGSTHKQDCNNDVSPQLHILHLLAINTILI